MCSLNLIVCSLCDAHTTFAIALCNGFLHCQLSSLGREVHRVALKACDGRGVGQIVRAPVLSNPHLCQTLYFTGVHLDHRHRPSASCVGTMESKTDAFITHCSAHTRICKAPVEPMSLRKRMCRPADAPMDYAAQS